jgi:hypothetical protein
VLFKFTSAHLPTPGGHLLVLEAAGTSARFPIIQEKVTAPWVTASVAVQRSLTPASTGVHENTSNQREHSVQVQFTNGMTQIPCHFMCVIVHALTHESSETYAIHPYQQQHGTHFSRRSSHGIVSRSYRSSSITTCICARQVAGPVGEQATSISTVYGPANCTATYLQCVLRSAGTSRPHSLPTHGMSVITSLRTRHTSSPNTSYLLSWLALIKPLRVIQPTGRTAPHTACRLTNRVQKQRFEPVAPYPSTTPTLHALECVIWWPTRNYRWRPAWTDTGLYRLCRRALSPPIACCL